MKEWKMVCDRCGKKYDSDNDVLEVQEFQCIEFIGGFGSVFGDENRVKCDLCQHCLKEFIGDYCYINGKKLGIKYGDSGELPTRTLTVDKNGNLIDSMWDIFGKEK